MAFSLLCHISTSRLFVVRDRPCVIEQARPALSVLEPLSLLLLISGHRSHDIEQEWQVLISVTVAPCDLYSPSLFQDSGLMILSRRGRWSSASL